MAKSTCFIIEYGCHHVAPASHGASQPVMLLLAVLAAVPLYLLIRERLGKEK